MNSTGSSMIMDILLQIMWFALPIFSLMVGIYAKDNFRGKASSLIFAGAVIQVIMKVISLFMRYIHLSQLEEFMSMFWIYQGRSILNIIGHLLFVLGILRLLKEIKAGAFDQGTGIKGNQLFF